MDMAEFEKYCSTIRDTGAWGGEPEILALSKSYNIPIHVVQGGSPAVVIHDPNGKPGKTDDPGVVRISYHRRMYGLGEVSLPPCSEASCCLSIIEQHYNSLRPRKHKTFSERLSAAFTGPS